MRIGLDLSYLKDESQPFTGLQYYLLGLLEGWQQIVPKPDIHIYICLSPSLTTSLTYIRQCLEQRNIRFPLHVYRRPAQRPYRLREMWQAWRSGFSQIDLFQIVGTPEYPRRAGKRRAFLIPDLVPLHRGGDLTAGSEDYWRDYFNLARDTGDLFITFSEHTRREFLAEFAVDPQRVVAIPLGVSPAFHPVAADELAPRLAPLNLIANQYFITVSTIEPRKNHLTLFRAYAELLKMHHGMDWPLVVVGAKGWKYEPILAEPQRLGIAAHVRFLGRQEDLAALYSGAGAFVYPSLYEGFGLPPLEAMACGAPVITSNATSLPEVVGDAGIMVAPEDAPALTAAMSLMMTDSQKREEYRRKGLERAGGFRWVNTAQAYLDAYRTLFTP